MGRVEAEGIKGGGRDDFKELQRILRERVFFIEAVVIDYKKA